MFPALPLFICFRLRKGVFIMMVKQQWSISEVDQDLLGSLSGCVGLTEKEMVTLMLCGGLTVADILDYIEAVTLNRIH